MEKFSFLRSTILELASVWSEMNPDKPVMIEGVPRYLEVIKNGAGYYFPDPDEAKKARVIYK